MIATLHNRNRFTDPIAVSFFVETQKVVPHRQVPEFIVPIICCPHVFSAIFGLKNNPNAINRNLERDIDNLSTDRATQGFEVHVCAVFQERKVRCISDLIALKIQGLRGRGGP